MLPRASTRKPAYSFKTATISPCLRRRIAELILGTFVSGQRGRRLQVLIDYPGSVKSVAGYHELPVFVKVRQDPTGLASDHHVKGIQPGDVRTDAHVIRRKIS